MRHQRSLTLAVTLWMVLSWRAFAAGPAITDIYSFTNGLSPAGDLAFGPHGSFYGVTSTGGPGNHGGVYEVSSNGLVSDFLWLNGNDGSSPEAGLIAGGNGSFFGTAATGGAQGCGSIFVLNGPGNLQELTSLVYTNGSNPLGPLLAGNNGTYIGTTTYGGSNGMGAVFDVNPQGQLTTLYSFTGGSNGANPASGLTQGANGNLYGTTLPTDPAAQAMAFELTYSGTLTTLGFFSNGLAPGAMVQAANGNFYGTAVNRDTNDYGAIFEVTANSNLVITAIFDGTNGAAPNSPLLKGDDGILYGTTEKGGTYGMGTFFYLTSTGAPVTLYSFGGGTNAIYPDSGVIESNDMFYGTASSATPIANEVIYELTDIPPFIMTPPRNQKWVTNGTATFSVVAGGGLPLAYQWQLNGVNIPGATTNSLVVRKEQLTNSGLYTVIVTNAFGSNAASAVLSLPAPKVALLSPRNGVRTNTIPFIITGTASAVAQVGAVNYWITNVNAGLPPSMAISNSVTGFVPQGAGVSWSIAVPNLLPGTNYVSVQSVDTLSNQSEIVTREFFYTVPSPFTVNINGLGTVKGGASVSNGAVLNIGQGYTLTASPARSNLFVNWTSAYFTNDVGTLHFIMESNLTVTATFTTNFFIGARGTYNGLFSMTSGVTEQTAGMLQNLVLRSNGTYSASLLLAGASYPVHGVFNGSGYSSNFVNRKIAAGGPLSLEMNLDGTGGEISGSVSGANWSSMLGAEESVKSPSAEYNALLEPSTNAMGPIPPGYGYLLITNHLGNLTLSGALADGSSFSQTVPLGVFGDAPVFNDNLYAHAGLLWGWLSPSNGPFVTVTNLTWIKPPAASGLYTNGFTNVLSVEGSAWTNLSRGYNPSVTVTISNVSLTLNFTASLTNKTVRKSGSSPTNSLTGTFNPATGLLNITFGNGTGKNTTAGHAILQESDAGGGYFLTKTNAGAIILGP